MHFPFAGKTDLDWESKKSEGIHYQNLCTFLLNCLGYKTFGMNNVIIQFSHIIYLYHNLKHLDQVFYVWHLQKKKGSSPILAYVRCHIGISASKHMWSLHITLLPLDNPEYFFRIPRPMVVCQKQQSHSPHQPHYHPCHWTCVQLYPQQWDLH